MSVSRLRSEAQISQKNKKINESAGALFNSPSSFSLGAGEVALDGSILGEGWRLRYQGVGGKKKKREGDVGFS